MIDTLPKVEIHRHLEGSLRLTSLIEIVREENLPLPTESDKLRQHVQITGDEPISATEFLEKFKTIRTFFRSKQTIQRLVDEVVEDASIDKVRLLELRFTPAALAQEGARSLEEVTDWVLSAAATAGVKYGVRVDCVLSVNRHEPVELAESVADIAIDRAAAGVGGLDLAGDEANFPASPFRDLISRARRAGLGITVHAGEWSGAANVREAIELLEANRIGHGIRVLEDADIAALAARRGVVFEVSLTSNWLTRASGEIGAHPLPDMIQAGLAVALTTDDPSIFNTSLSKELRIAQDQLGCSTDTLKAFNLTALQSTFIPEREKRELERELVQAYWTMEGGLAADR